MYTSSTDKAKDYASKILTYTCERDDDACLVCSTDTLEDLVNTIAASSNKDLHCWRSVVEMLSLTPWPFQNIKNKIHQMV